VVAFMNDPLNGQGQSSGMLFFQCIEKDGHGLNEETYHGFYKSAWSKTHEAKVLQVLAW